MPQLQQSTPLASLAAVKRGLAAGSCACGAAALTVALLTSGQHPILVLTATSVMALTWGLFMWLALFPSTRSMWVAAPTAMVRAAGLAAAARRGVRRGVTVALIGSLAILAAAAPMSWFFPDIEFWWWVWPGFTLAVLLWSVLDLRDLTRWQRAARCELFMRYDVRVLSSATRAGDRLVAVETAV